MENNKNCLDKDELVSAAVALDAANYIIQEMQEDFFDAFNRDSDEDKFRILWEFNRNRAKMAILSTLIHEISQAFEKNKIDCYLSA